MSHLIGHLEGPMLTQFIRPTAAGGLAATLTLMAGGTAAYAAEPPTAVDDAATGSPGSSVIIDVLANDTYDPATVRVVPVLVTEDGWGVGTSDGNVVEVLVSEAFDRDTLTVEYVVEDAHGWDTAYIHVDVVPAPPVDPVDPVDPATDDGVTDCPPGTLPNVIGTCAETEGEGTGVLCLASQHVDRWIPGAGTVRLAETYEAGHQRSRRAWSVEPGKPGEACGATAYTADGYETRDARALGVVMLTGSENGGDHEVPRYGRYGYSVSTTHLMCNVDDRGRITGCDTADPILVESDWRTTYTCEGPVTGWSEVDPVLLTEEGCAKRVGDTTPDPKDPETPDPTDPTDRESEPRPVPHIDAGATYEAPSSAPWLPLAMSAAALLAAGLALRSTRLVRR